MTSVTHRCALLASRRGAVSSPCFRYQHTTELEVNDHARARVHTYIHTHAYTEQTMLYYYYYHDYYYYYYSTIIIITIIIIIISPYVYFSSVLRVSQIVRYEEAEARRPATAASKFGARDCQTSLFLAISLVVTGISGRVVHTSFGLTFQIVRDV